MLYGKYVPTFHICECNKLICSLLYHDLWQTVMQNATFGDAKGGVLLFSWLPITV